MAPYWMRLMLAVVAAAVVLCSADRLALSADLAAARSLLHLGRYAEAAERYAAETEHDPAAAVGLARCRIAVGKYEEAEQALAAAADRFPKSAALAAELALSAYRRGDHPAAEKRAAAALAIDQSCAPARWVAAELLKYSGRMDEAQQAYRWFVTYYNQAPRIEDPQTLVFIGRGVAEHARWTRNSNQFRRLVGDVYPAALRVDKEYWPARLEAALLYLEKYNEADAAVQIAAGLVINPQSADLHAARAALALGSFDLATAKASLDRAMAINPRHVWAHQLRADWLLADVRPDEAKGILEEARRINARDELTLGRLAASYAAVDGRPGGQHSPRVQTLIDEVTGRNPHCGEFFLAAGQACDRLRRFPQAAEFYRLAAERMPQLLATRGHLGLVLMRLGDEAEAAKLLEESFAIDPFNVRVKNQLEVLGVLANYAVQETDHFVIKFDRGQNELLARYVARHLEEDVFPDLTRRLGFAPKDKTLVEIFSRYGNTAGHNWFSARMVGLPLIGPVGACAGKMVALSSPKELSERYDWARVLKHEMVHVINLQQTDFNVPHWFTEGLAVHLEDQPRPRAWTELLARRARSGALFTLDAITLGFVRPASADDWTLAYCQAELYVEHLIEKYGEDAPGRMLAAYADHLSTSQALAKLFGVTQAQFEADYRLLVERIAAQVKLPSTAAPPTLAELQRKAADAPRDADAAAELSRAWLDRDDKPLARRWAVAAQQLQHRHQLAAYVLARLQLSIGDTDAAIKLLEQSLDENSPQEDLLALLAALKLKANDTAAALRLYEQGDSKLPHSDRWVKGLVKIHLQSGDSEKLTSVLQRLLVREPDNRVVQQKLAELALTAWDFPRAAALARQTVHTDVEDPAGHALLAAALAGQEKHAAAVEEYETSLKLGGEQAALLAGLARSLIALLKKDDARRVIGRLRELNADDPRLPDLEQRLAP
jgi:tetratricopeptide (TPR) repeat protein